MSGLQISVDLGATVEYLGRAIGLLRTSGSGLELDHTFFADPGERLAAFLSDPDQRAASLDAIELLLPADGQDGRSHPLADVSGLRVSLTLTQPTPDEAVLGVLLDAAGPVGAVSIDIPVLLAAGDTLDSVVGTDAHPAEVRASTAIADGGELAVTVRLAGPDVVAHSTLLVSIGLPGQETLTLDPADRPDVGRVLSELVGQVAASAGAPPEVDHLVGALGLSDGLPVLPLAPAPAGSTYAWRSWLSSLAHDLATGGRPALEVWLAHVAALLGAAASGTGVTLAAPAGSRPGLELLMTPNADLTSLSWTVRAWFEATAAELAVQLELAEVPLSGTAPAAVGDAGEVTATVPGSGSLYPGGTTADPTLGIGRLLAGIGWSTEGLRPVLALDDLRLALPGTEPVEVDHLDLTSTDTLLSLGSDLLSEALRDGLGASPAAAALLRLAGLDPPPGVAAVDPAQLATDPHRALAAYHLQVRDSSKSWSSDLAAVWVLLGGSPPGGDLDAVVATGGGSREDPWRLPLDHLGGASGGGGSAPSLSLIAWSGEESDEATPRFCLGLLAELQVELDEAAAPLPVSLAVELVGLDVDPVHPPAPQVLGSVVLRSAVGPLGLGTSGDATVTLGSASPSLTWDGGHLSFGAVLTGLEVSGPFGTATVAELDPKAGIDLDAPDLGLGAGDGAALWTVVRDLVAAAAGALGGTARLATTIGGTAGDGAEPGQPGVGLLGDGVDVRDLLGDVVAAIAAWLAGTLTDPHGVAADGRPHLVRLLDRLPPLLNGRAGTSSRTDDDSPVTTGSGTLAVPWSTPLHDPGSPSFEVLSWIDGDGPAGAWADSGLALLAPPPPFDPDPPEAGEPEAGEPEPDAEDAEAEAGFQPGDGAWPMSFAPDGEALAAAVAALGAVGGPHPFSAEDLQGPVLDTLAMTLAESDGLVAVWESDPGQPGWEVGPTVPASHWELPSHRDAVQQVAAHVRRCTADALDWTLVVVDADLADPGAWEPLAAELGLPPPVPASLRVPGVDPVLVDLHGLPSSPAYVVDLADDGAPMADLVERLRAALTQIRAVRGIDDVVLVAHSWAGVASTTLAAESPGGVRGLCVLGTPFVPSVCHALADADLADTVHALGAVFAPGTLGAHGRLLARLQAALDGWRADDTGAAPASVAWPPDLLSRAAEVPPPPAVPCLAVQGLLASDLRTAVRLAAWQLGPGADEPGEVAHGLRLGLDLGEPVEGEAEVDLTLRLDLGRSRLLPGDGPAAAAYEVAATLRAPGGWLLGGPTRTLDDDGTELPSTGPVSETRLRWARLVSRVEPSEDSASGSATTTVELYDGWHRGAGGPRLTLADPASASISAALFSALGEQALLGGRVARLLDLMSGVGLVTGTGASTSLLVDGVASLQGDLAGPVAGRVRALLDRAGGAAGVVRDPAAAAGRGPWTYQHPDLPVLLTITTSEIRVETTGDGFETGPDTWLTATSTIDLPVPAAATDLDVAARDARLIADHATGELRLESAALPRPAVLVPPAPDLVELLAEPALRAVTGAALSAVLAQVRPGHSTPFLGGLLSDPGAALTRWLGDGDPDVRTGGDLDPARVQQALAEVAALCGARGHAGRPLLLPADLGMYATAASGGLRLGVRTAGPLPLPGGGTLDVDLWLDVDGTGGVQPGGLLSLRIELPASGWDAVTLDLGTGPDGATLSVLPERLGSAISLLPSVSGLDVLLGGGAQLLLAAALDTLVARLRVRPGQHRGLDAGLAVAAAFGLVDEAGEHFDGVALTALAAELGSGSAPGNAAQRAAAIADALEVLLPDVHVVASGTTVTIDATLLEGGTTVTIDLATAPPAVTVGFSGVASGVLATDVEATFTSGSTSVSATLAADLDLGRGAHLTPAMELDAAAGRVQAITLDALGDGIVLLRLAPNGRNPTASQAADLTNRLGVPLAVRLALGALGSDVDDALWTDGPSLADLLIGARLAVRGGSPPPSVAPVAPTAVRAASGLLGALEGTEVQLVSGLVLGLAHDDTRYGVALRGAIALPLAPRPATLHLGLPEDVDPGWEGADAGLSLLVVDVGDGDLRLDRSLRLDGLGLAVTGPDGAALVDTAAVVLGELGLFGQWELDLDGRVRVVGTPLGAVQIGALGFPLLPSGNDSNPVAASLLASTGGDQAPANPPLDVLVSSVPGGWLLLFGGEPTLRLAVQQTFGPLYLDAVEVSYDPATRTIHIAVDGSVAVGPLTVSLAELTVELPIHTLSNPTTWALDLAGLAVSLVTETVSVLGALRRMDLPAGDVEYIGALSVIVPGRTLSALGSYAQPHDTEGDFASFFGFVNVPIPLGGPPFFFVLGLAAGVGYNRRLIVPDDPADVPSFALVAVMNGDVDLGEDPMVALRAMAADLPPSRGAYWGAAGVRFTTFGIIQGTALVYVSLDTGVEVGVLGLLELVLPPVSSASVLSIQLGLAASYSAVDQVLSVEAALAENSWLFSPDCRLTGGFAFVAWLATPEVLLTIGGYHPDFDVPDYYPTVDPVGFAWTPLAGVSVKGGSYFALTHSALMLGGRLEVSYDRGVVRAWFETSVDVMVTWDPLTYTASFHIGVGAEIEVEACLFVCVTARVAVNVGADLSIAGPPLSGTASVDLGVTSITVSFGSKVSQPWLTWAEVLARYVTAGDGPATCTTVLSGRLESEASGAAEGTEDAPWLVGTQFVLATDSPMPCTETLLDGGSAGTHLPAGISAPGDIDVVPAGPSIGATEVSLVVEVTQRTTSGWGDVPDGVLDSLEVTGVQGSYQAAVWEAGRSDEPGAPMLKALGGVQLTASTSVAEQTGTLGVHQAVPISSLVEEEAALPLPLHDAPIRWDGPFTDFPGPADLPGTGQPGRPRLLGRSAQRSRGSRTSGADAADEAETVALRGDDAALWDVRRARPDGLRLRTAGSAVRLVGLSGTGAPLVDTVVATTDGQELDLSGVLPRGTARLVATSHDEVSRCAGWQLRTPMVPLAAGTFLAQGATVLTGAPVEVHRRYAEARGGLARLPAAVALDGQGMTTTVAERPGDVLVVQYDDPGDAGVEDPLVELVGARHGAAHRLVDQDRVTLVFPLTRASGALRVRVVSRGGVTAGVVVLDGRIKDVVRRLTERPWHSLLASPAGTQPAAPPVSRVTRVTLVPRDPAPAGAAR
jgi:large repetitive protein